MFTLWESFIKNCLVTRRPEWKKLRTLADVKLALAVLTDQGVVIWRNWDILEAIDNLSEGAT